MSLITKPMLADTPNEHIEMIFPLLASPKLDGIRCLVTRGRIVSRKFLDIPNQHIQKVMKAANLPEELDGEIIIPDASFNEIQSAVMRESGEPDFRYYVFDYVTTSLTEAYAERMKKLEALSLPDFCVKVLPKLINNKDELTAYEEECLAAGYEGIMTRIPHGKYKTGRSTAREQLLLKVKRFQDAEAEIIGFEELMSNQNEAEKDELGHTKRSKALSGLVATGMLGAFIVRELGNTPWKGKTFKVGVLDGFTPADRKEIWENQSKYLGKILTYVFQPHGVKDLPRIPVGKGIRHPADM